MRIVSVVLAAGLAINAALTAATAVSASPASLTSPARAAPATARFVPVGPVRLADTRAGADAACGCVRSDAHTIRVVIAGRHGIPDGIIAAAVTITATSAASAGYVTVFPAGRARPSTSTLNVSAGVDAANSTISAVGDGGAIDLYSSVTGDVVVDVTGVFTPATTASAGRFVPVVPTRMVDTRLTMPSGISPGGSVTVPLPAGVSSDAVAVSVNVTSVDARSGGYLSVFAAGSPPPPTSFANPDGTGAALAASVIVPVSPDGLTVRSSPGGQIVIDLTGWFTGPSAAESSDGLFTALDPTRLVDTRTDAPRLWSGGAREVAAPVPGITALITNVTLVETDGNGFVTAYPAGTPRPPTSSLNAAARDVTIANFAITTVTDRGTTYFASRGTDLIVDATGAFTGPPMAASLPVPANDAPVPRVLMIGDSTLGGLVDVPQAQRALRGFVPLLDAKPCRRLIHLSCTSRFTQIAPNTAVEAIRSAPGPIDIAVIKAGYNDSSSSDFATAVARVVAEARAKGAQVVIWLTYSESTRAGSYDTANATLRRLAGSATYPDLVVADWRTYASATTHWYATDRVHLLTDGVWATADYVSRWVASVSRLPCPVPWSPAAVIDARCPSPDRVHADSGTLPELRALYGF